MLTVLLLLAVNATALAAVLVRPGGRAPGAGALPRPGAAAGEIGGLFALMSQPPHPVTSAVASPRAKAKRPQRTGVATRYPSIVPTVNDELAASDVRPFVEVSSAMK